MTRPIELTRDEAELLDTLLLGYFANGGTDERLREVAEELCRIWGMSPWHARDVVGEAIEAAPRLLI